MPASNSIALLARALLILLPIWLLNACGSGKPSTLNPPPEGTSSTTIVVRPTPIETRDPFVVFTERLKAAVEQNDDNNLKTLIGTPWISGRYNADLTEYREVADVVAAFRTMRQRAAVSLDLDLTGTHPAPSPRPGERIVVAHWNDSSGREEPAFLYASFVNGGWHWTGLLIGVPLDQVMAQPSGTPTLPPTAAAPTVLPSPEAATPTAAALPATVMPSSGAAMAISGRLVYVRGSDLAVFNIGDNSQSRIEARVPTVPFQIDWSRDGKRAVFLTGTAEQNELWLVNRDGSRLVKVGTPARYRSPRWSPDGTVILYSVKSPAPAAKNEIWSLTADGTVRRKVADGFDPAWAPDGQRFAFASNPSVQGNGIHVVNAQGKNEWAPLTTSTPSLKFTSLGWDMSQSQVLDSPQWSPDGKELTVRVQGGYGAYVTTDSIAGDFGKFIALYFDGVAHGFSYSPNGIYVALATGGQSGFETIGIYRRSDIGRDGISGSPLRTLGNAPRTSGQTGQSVLGYAWAPAGTHVAYALGKAGMWVMDIASGATAQINADGVAPLAWLP
jgi:hypothetical protein